MRRCAVGTLMAAHPSSKGEQLSMEALRKRMGAMFRLPKTLSAGVKSEDVQIPVEGGEIFVRVYTPEKPASGAAMLVWYHGGGWVLGHPNMDDENCSQIVAAHGMVVMSVDYRLAPEFPFPTGVNDCFAALKWAVANASQYGAAPETGLLVGGASTGGNLAAVISILARDDSSFKSKVTGQLLVIPAVCSPQVYPEEYKSEFTAYSESEDFPGRNKAYNVPDHSDIRLSPLLAPLNGLPKAFIQVHGRDPLRDDGIVYSKALAANGVETQLHVYPGWMHGFHGAFPQTKLAIKHVKDAQEGIKWLLGN